jgi:predicted DNA-binding transcriptional regulator AlpA
MSGGGREQGAFAWSAETAREVDAGRHGPGVERPEAPPTACGGGARGAARGKRPRAEPLRAAPAPRYELPPDNELWDVRAAARFLKRSVSWVYHRAEDGTLPVRRLGGWGIRFIPGELRAWVAGDAGRPGR